MPLNKWLDTEQKIDRGSIVIWILLLAFIAFLIWSMIFELDQFVRSQGQVVSSSRVQIIQTVDGGVLSEVNVKEGEIVQPGHILARIDQTRFAAQTNEIKFRVLALMAKVARLRAEVTQTVPDFPRELATHQDLIDLELTIYKQRIKRLMDESSSQNRFVELARHEKALLDELEKTGDIAQTEILDAERKIVEAESKLEAIRNDYYETSSQELAKFEDELAQNSEVLRQRTELLRSSVLKAQVYGIVKNLTVTTLGAVTRAGEELMQIVPLNDQLLVETKIPPSDIGDLETGLPATLRFDPFDSSVYGTVDGVVEFISADTIEEDNGRGGSEKFYVARVALPSARMTTSIGKTIDIIPGMTAQVDIKTGKRTVLNYLLKPIVKTLDNSFGEK